MCGRRGDGGDLHAATDAFLLAEERGFPDAMCREFGSWPGQARQLQAARNRLLGLVGGRGRGDESRDTSRLAACLLAGFPDRVAVRAVGTEARHGTMVGGRGVVLPPVADGHDLVLALRLFEGQQAEALGAICLSMCGSNDPTCTGQPKPGACQSSQNDIRTLNDFQARIPQLITDLVSGRAEQELRKSLIAAGGTVQLDLAFVLGLDQALAVFQKVAVNFVTDLLGGKSPTLAVPVQAEGSVFFELKPVGRFGVGYGPLRTTWNIDSTILN